jgi:maltokinase
MDSDSTRLPEGSDVLAGLLREWLPNQRWYAAKGRVIRNVEVASDIPLVEGDPSLHHLLVAVDSENGIEHYQLLVGRRAELPRRLVHAAIGRVNGGTAYDAAHDWELTSFLLRHFAAGDDVGPLRFRHFDTTKIPTTLVSLVITSEQSNTSMVFGDELILKMFRRLTPGINPDLEVTLALAKAGSKHVAGPVAWLEMPFSGPGSPPDSIGEPTTLAMLQTFLRTATNGWDLASTSVRDLYAEADLHADEVGGDFAGEAHRLGFATAEVHRDLAQTLPTDVLTPDAVGDLAKAMMHRLEDAAEQVPALVPYVAGLRGAFEELAQYGASMPVQRIHGDYHLGQVLRTSMRWVLLDFEGEPAKPLEERTALSSPLRDVAAMLRSFDYAARHLLADHPRDSQLEYRAVEWADRNRDAFCRGYAEASGTDPREEIVLLRAFETDKAIYECVYEARNRPSWLPIPLSAVQRLVG